MSKAKDDVEGRAARREARWALYQRVSEAYLSGEKLESIAARENITRGRVSGIAREMRCPPRRPRKGSP